MALIAFWLLSKWLTKIFYEWVLNPLTNNALYRHEGLVVMISGSLWTLIFMGLYGWFIYPELAFRTPQEKWQALWVFAALGAVWGCSIAGMILAEWWIEQRLALEPVYEPGQMLGEPVRLSPADASNGSGPTFPQPARISEEKQESILDEAFGKPAQPA
jgi:hypothetical protein